MRKREETGPGSCVQEAPSLPVCPGRDPTAGPARLSPLAQGLAHAEAHALQDQQAGLLSLEGQGREAQGPSATSSRWCS